MRLILLSYPLYQIHKSAWPFLKAVDKKLVPDYYVIIKEPMGK